MNLVNEPDSQSSNPDAKRKILLLAGAASAWGLILILLAIVLPIVTPQGAPAVAPPAPAIRAGTATALPVPSAPRLVNLPRVTLVGHDGYAVLFLVALPMLISVVVGLLLWWRTAGSPRSVTVIAWVLAIALLVAALIGAVTILVGLAVLPTGILLVILCVDVARPAPTHLASLR